jgi:hypothetical protein
MSKVTNELVVRRHERIACALPAVVAIADDSRGAMRLSRSHTRPDGSIDVEVVDVAAGGMGLSSALFLPRGCGLSVEIKGAGGEVFSARVRVQRVLMSDRTPTYYIGASFEGADASAVEGLIARAKASRRENAA